METPLIDQIQLAGATLIEYAEKQPRAPHIRARKPLRMRISLFSRSSKLMFQNRNLPFKCVLEFEGEARLVRALAQMERALAAKRSAARSAQLFAFLPISERP